MGSRSEREPIVDGSVDPGAIPWERARRLTLGPFLSDGRCALIPAGDGLVLPSGEVLTGEGPMLDTGLRVPLVTPGLRPQGFPPFAASRDPRAAGALVPPGFRRQGFPPFAASGDHVWAWCEGDDGYRGARPHTEVELWKGPADEAARRLRAAGGELAGAGVGA